jgi:hypothetical protein
MSDNTQLSAAVGSGDTIRDKDRSGVKTQIVGLDLNPNGGSEVLMAAAPLADATANPTTFLDGACLHGFNGTTWDRLRVDGSKNLYVIVGAALPAGANVIGAVTQSGTWTVATNADVAVGAGTAPSKALAVAGVYNASLPTLTSGQTAGLQLDSSGRLLVASIANTVTVGGLLTVNQGGAPWSENITYLGGNAINTGTGTTGAGTLRVVLATDQPQLSNALLVAQSGTWTAQAQQSGTWTVQPGNTQNTTPWLVTPTPATSGGTTPYSYIAAGSANQDSQNIKASAGQLYGYAMYNTASTVRYVKVYNKATAPTSADTPALRILVPPGGGANLPVGDTGIAFGSGIGIRITTGVGDGDTGTATANDVLLNLWYR